MKPDRGVGGAQREEGPAFQWYNTGTHNLGARVSRKGLGEWGWGAGNQKDLLGAMLTTAGQDCDGEEFLHTQAGPEKEE